MALTPDEQRARNRAEALAQDKLAAARAIESVVNDAWDNATRSYWPEEAITEIADAQRRLDAGELDQRDHDALVTSINARTRRIYTPESAKVTFDAKLAAARRDNATAVDSLSEAQLNSLWDSIR